MLKNCVSVNYILFKVFQEKLDLFVVIQLRKPMKSVPFSAL